MVPAWKVPFQLRVSSEAAARPRPARPATMRTVGAIGRRLVLDTRTPGMTGEERSRSGSLAGRCEAAVFFLLKSSIGSFVRWSRVRFVSLLHEPRRIVDPVADTDYWDMS